MPYDPRPVSQGGNRGIDETFSRSAPSGTFRVIGVDTFDGDDWVEGDFPSLSEALSHVRTRTSGQQMLMMHVYDEHGRHMSDAGSF